ncbi:hypothetical protein BaRGS_00031857 [Batillaria attramentaria]|uniref:C-type lectin domain-containing protein n=1 Tax=Batillaria attramentaria TaxID=370345 RepID=A0ABD0JPD8_9CAEN
MKGMLVACTLALLCQLTAAGIGEICCPSGWERYEDSCYYFNTVKKNWVDAQKACKDMYPEANLVEIGDSGENSFLKGKLQALNFDQTWTGANDAFEEGTFRWIGSFDPLTFTSWKSGEPNDSHNDEDCGTIWKAAGYKWNDGICATLMTSICEM